MGTPKKPTECQPPSRGFRVPRAPSPWHPTLGTDGRHGAPSFLFKQDEYCKGKDIKSFCCELLLIDLDRFSLSCEMLRCFVEMIGFPQKSKLGAPTESGNAGLQEPPEWQSAEQISNSKQSHGLLNWLKFCSFASNRCCWQCRPHVTWRNRRKKKRKMVLQYCKELL